MTVLLCILITFVISVFVIKQTSYYLEFMDWFMASVIGVVVGIILGGIITCLLPMETTYKRISLEIISLQDNQGISGNFYLGSGYIDDNMKYVFYYKLGDNEYKMMAVDYNLATIRYTNQTPKVSITEIVPTDGFINHFAYDFNIHSKTYVLEVPAGSILNNYKLDSQ